MKTGNDLGSGYFLTFPPSESKKEEKVIKFLEKSGYEISADGIKNFLIDQAEGKNSSARRVGNLLTDNPELINMGLNALGNILKKRTGL
jgi:hypothetical protein